MKTIKVKNSIFQISGFTNGFASYGKNANGRYRIEANLDWGLGSTAFVRIYEGKKKPMFRHLGIITALLVPITPLFIIAIFLLALASIYIEGAINFYKDKTWQNSVRAFNWLNIGLVIILIVLNIIQLIY
ncbi:MAG: hypothetical protein JXR34_10640 [Bacteroidales bacterium]|nr:hypothetical protein [Bacteroidales bacterium]